MALAKTVASTEWEDALYKVLYAMRDAGGYIADSDLKRAGISDADRATILSGYNEYVTDVATTSRDKTITETAV